ncbi:MAG: hypothetical protein QM715_03350 [Nibricoccus sp.]
MRIQGIFAAFFLACPVLAIAQNSGGFDFNRGVPSTGYYGPHGGESDFMVGASGTANRRMDDTLAGLNFSLGHYFTNMQALVLRQTVNYSHPAGGDRAWSGSSRLAFDQYLSPHSRWRPFIGVNFGGVYGDDVTETWAAGLEAGMKFYVRPRVFIEVMAEYAWYFRHSNNIDDRFDTGHWNWSLGTGFTF